MIEVFIFCFGFLLYFIDIAIIPSFSNYLVITDLVLFCSFHLYEIKKERALGFFIFFMILKAILVPNEKLLLFLSLYMIGFILFILVLQGVKLEKRVTVGVIGFLVLSLEYSLFKKSFSSSLLPSLAYQTLIWLCMIPVLDFYERIYMSHLRRKGDHV